MRKIETRVRRQKDIALAAKAAGDEDLQWECSEKIKALADRYDEVCKASGLSQQRNRMRVEGFRPYREKAQKAPLPPRSTAVNVPYTTGATRMEEDIIKTEDGYTWIEPGATKAKVDDRMSIGNGGAGDKWWIGLTDEERRAVDALCVRCLQEGRYKKATV